jgi:hypothetical protein
MSESCAVFTVVLNPFILGIMNKLIDNWIISVAIEKTPLILILHKGIGSLLRMTPDMLFLRCRAGYG